MRGRAGSLVLVLGLALGAVGCGESRASVLVGFRFDPPELAETAVAVEVRKIEGDCQAGEASGPPDIRFERGGAAAGRLDVGNAVTLYARARDLDCRWFARACAFVRGGGDPERIELSLRPVDALPMCEPGRCSDGVCAGGDLPDGFVAPPAPDASPAEPPLDDGRDASQPR